MKKYNCEIYKIKERKVKDKFRYEIVGYKIYPNLTKEMALHLAVKYGGGISGFDENNDPCHPNNSDRVIGFEKWYSDVQLASVSPIYCSDDFLTDTTIIPKLQVYETPKRNMLFDEKISKLIELYRSDIFDDFSIESYHIWAPNSLIPAGYEHIKNGAVREGDYIFRYELHSNRSDCWESVGLSWVRHKIGTEIEYKGILSYKGDQGFRKDGDVIRGYEPFVIRKKIKK